MSGYRQSRFDPDAFAQPGRPLRPYNWVQWIGVALATIGAALYLVYFAGRMGWIAPLFDNRLGFVLLIVGVVLINSRREPATLVEAEQHWKNRKVLLITIAVVAIILGAASIIEFAGA